jgi:hypothetical protein
MRLKLVPAAAAAALAISLLGAAGATAATEFGDNCQGDSAATDYTLTTLSGPSGPLPLTAPSAGVVTRVRLNVDGEGMQIAIPTSVKTLRSVGGKSFLVTGQATVNVFGDTTADVRLPVQAGDRLGLRGQPFSIGESPVPGISFFCAEEAEGVLGAVAGDPQPGSTTEFSLENPNSRVPISAILEPDVDNDGFGDETQDKCPQSAALQVACPPVTIDVASQVTRKSVRLLVATSQTAPVSVTGVVGLGKKRKATLVGGAQTVPAGKIAGFTLKFPRKLKTRLLELAPKQKLTLRITTTATNAAGLVSTHLVKAKLKGQGR